MVKRAGIGSMLQRFATKGLKRVSEKLPGRIAGLGASVQSGGGKLLGKLGFKDVAKRLSQKATGARQILGLGKLSPKQIGYMKFLSRQATPAGQIARGSAGQVGSAFRTGLGALGVGGAIAGAGAYDASTGKLFGGGGQPQQPAGYA